MRRWFSRSKKRPLLGDAELANIRKLRNAGQLDKAEKLLRNAEPTPAVLDELRKIASTRAKQAKQAGDWQAVITHLEGYNRDAEQHRQHCLDLVNQAPPAHTKTDQRLLQQAREQVAGA